MLVQNTMSCDSSESFLLLKRSAYAISLVLLILITTGFSEPQDTKALLELSLEELMNIEINTSASLTGTTRQTTPSTLTTITQAQIADSAARDLAELLDIYVPNFQWITHNWDQRHMGLRGINSNLDDKYLLLVNGRVMNQHTDFGVCTERDLPMLRDIHHVDIVRGPGSALYGPGALAMVINIITEDGDTFSGEEVIARAGAVHRLASLEYKRGRKLSDEASFYLYTAVGKVNGADIEDSPIVLGRSQTYNGVTYGPEHEHKDLFSNQLQGYQDRPKWKLHGQYKCRGLDVWARFTQGGEQIDSLNGKERHFKFGQGYHQATLYTGYKQSISKDTNLRYVFSYDQTTATSQGLERWRFREEELYARILGDWKPHDQHAFALGSEWSHERFGNRASSSPAYHWRMGNMPRWSTNLLSLFGEYQWRIMDPLTLFASARLDDHTYTDAMFSPRGVLIYTPTIKDSIKLMASRSARTNSGAEMKLQHQTDGADSDTETLKAYEVRYERQWTKTTWLAGSVFYHDHDVLGWSGGVKPLGNVQSWGYEFEYSHRRDRLRFDASHSYTKMLDMTFAPGVSNTELTSEPMEFGNNFANWSNHQTKLVAHWDASARWGLDSSVNIYWGYPGGRSYALYRNSVNSSFYDPSYTRSFDPSVFFNLGATYQWDEQTTVQISGHNLAGLFDKYANKRRSGYNTSWPGTVRMHAPSISLTVAHKF